MLGSLSVGHLRLRKNPQTEPTEHFCEHDHGPCMFCKGNVQVGHYVNESIDETVVRHSQPHCAAFTYAEDVENFRGLSILKARSDLGQRVMN